MNEQELEEYKKLGEKLICVPSGLKRKDGTDIMSWSLREWFEEKTEENDTYVEYENTIEEETQDYYLIKEDEEQYNPKSNSITNSEHDKLFKKILENREQTAKFLDMVLGSGKDITAKNLELYNKEFITDKFEKNETDIVYKVTNLNVYIIIEHQSTEDRTMPYRVRRYKTALMESVINKKEMKKANYKLPRLIAIVLYTGKQEWKNKKLEDIQEPLKWYKEDYDEFILIDVNSFKKENSIISKRKDFTIVYEDENILIVNKPVNLLVHLGEDLQEDDLSKQVLNYLIETNKYCPDKENSFVPSLAHRIDRNTSGLVVFGLKHQALQELFQAFKDHEGMEKIYTALVCGKTLKEGKIDAPLLKNEKTKIVSVDKKGQKALTTYTTIKTYQDVSLLKVKIHTGRTHQIRVHLNYINHPLVGDSKYGNKESDYLKNKYHLKNYFLHATSLTFHNLKNDLAYLNNKTFIAPFFDWQEKLIKSLKEEGK